MDHNNRKRIGFSWLLAKFGLGAVCLCVGDNAASSGSPKVIEEDKGVGMVAVKPKNQLKKTS